MDEVEYVGGPRNLTVVMADPSALPEFEPAPGGRYRLDADRTYRWEVGYADSPDVVHVRPRNVRHTTR